MIHKSATFTTKAVNEEKRMVEGYASVFSNLDSDRDRLMKGAFGRTIKEWGPEGKNRIKLVSQHNINKPVAKIVELKEDAKGLYMKAQFGTHQDGDDHYRMVKEGILTEFSIGFVGTSKEDNEYGGLDFKEVKLYEVSLVTVAANDEALVTAYKSLSEESDPTNIQRLDGLLALAKSMDDKDAAFHIQKHALALKQEFEDAANEVSVKDAELRQEAEQKSAEAERMLKLAKDFGIEVEG